MNRRQFLVLVAAGVAAGCADTLRASFGPPLVAATPSGPRKVASLAALTATPSAFPLQTANGGDQVYAYKDGEQVVVLSNVCTHRGCPVAWEAASNRFVCPCHDGTFDRAGKVLAGPPLGPLMAYSAMLVGDDVMVQA
ncbi:MAG: Rieske Fe-S protein [Cyanobacteria bacterium RYN_339]|nr:Rieske Fe-S protein [Cyanobacteria bacterium RYN_339]